MKLRWHDKIPDMEVLDRTGILSIHAMLRQVQLRWSGHLVRMDEERLPKRLLCGDVATGARRQGGQKRHCKDTLKKSLKQLQINPVTREDLAQDRPALRSSVKTGSAIYKANRIATAKAKRAARNNQITEKLEDLHAPVDNATVETRWWQLRNVIQSTTLDVLGRARCQQQDWCDDNDTDISNLLAEKNGLRKAYMDLWTDATKAAFFRCQHHVQQRLWEMQDAWMIRKAEEIQGYADRNEMKNFFKAIKAIYGPCIKGNAPLLSSDGTTLLTENSQILKRWAKHFERVLNCSSAISDDAIDRLPQVDKNNELDLPPSLPETIRALQQISSGKAWGSDAIPPEVYKHGGPRLMAELTTLFQELWR
ncbi:unnamed protein product [Schistocephalus solidus]|uniref:Uncharacterized protein n=1 Tax=Schistocephalus solidus TaxID=70667 RepID=A0A183TJJ4_SCHSO|nr:unnamed protein product [Schistocephalus solidus]